MRQFHVCRAEFGNIILFYKISIIYNIPSIPFKNAQITFIKSNLCVIREKRCIIWLLLNSTDTEVPNPVLDGVIVALTIRFLYCQVFIYQFDKHASYIQGTDINMDQCKQCGNFYSIQMMWESYLQKAL